MIPLIKTEDLTKCFRLGNVKLPVLKGISLEIQQGEQISLVGASGSGKSTLLNILGFLDSPDSGRYDFKGRSIYDTHDDQRTRIRGQHFGFVFQHFFLLPEMTALQNTELPLLYRNISKKERRDRAARLLEKVGLDQHFQHHPQQLSGGQQQRVAIARALINDPTLILADEPTGALDSRAAGEILDLFIRLNEEENMTLVLVTHDPNVAKRAGRVVRLKDGRLVPDMEFINE